MNERDFDVWRRQNYRPQVSGGIVLRTQATVEKVPVEIVAEAAPVAAVALAASVEVTPIKLPATD